MLHGTVGPRENFARLVVSEMSTPTAMVTIAQERQSEIRSPQHFKYHSKPSKTLRRGGRVVLSGKCDPGSELKEFDLHHVSILQLVSVTQPNVGSDFNDIPRVVSRALIVLIRAQ